MIQCITELYEHIINNKTGNNLWRNTEARSCANFCGGKAICIDQPECVFAAVGIQHAISMSHIVICGQHRSTKFFHIISQTQDFRKKKLLNLNFFFDFHYKFCLKHISFKEELREI